MEILTFEVMQKILLLLVISLWVVSCGSNDNGGRSETKPLTSNKQTKSAKVPKVISIYCYEGFPSSIARKLEKQLKEYHPNVELKNAAMVLPIQHFNKDRNRYRATGLFGEISRCQHGDAVIGLIDHVIFKPNEISNTFGIMGLSPVGSYKCVVSSRLPRTGKTQKPENFVKLALHELGHAYGLPHCPDQHCYMVDAEHKMKFPQTTGFCKGCKNRLNAKGWTIK